ncbi:MAG: oligopeptide/dipeptide ABC transporter ATP-binding protein [Pseudomonadota bacterium]
MPEKNKPPLLEVQDLLVKFPRETGMVLGPKSYIHAVDGVSFALPKGTSLGLVGESGSGKTTTALAVARLIDAQGGRVLLDGEDVLALGNDELRKIRARLQFIFQDPYSSLNPRMRAEAILREPLESLRIGDASSRGARVREIFAAVGLRPEQLQLFPHQFSGGQRQRIGIARALVSNPELIICDEPVSALDVAVQAQILNLLRRLQKQFSLTCLFISHDLGVVQYMCDTVAVMYRGKIVEIGDRQTLFHNPQHPYTKALLQAVPTVQKTRKKNKISV